MIQKSNILIDDWINEEISYYDIEYSIYNIENYLTACVWKPFDSSHLRWAMLDFANGSIEITSEEQIPEAIEKAKFYIYEAAAHNNFLFIDKQLIEMY
jgi:hypothetical protein